MTHQLTMSGNDWLSDRDIKTIKRLQAARQKAAQKAAASLQRAADDMAAFSFACMECNDDSAPRREDDSRTILQRNMREYAGWLEDVFR